MFKFFAVYLIYFVVFIAILTELISTHEISPDILSGLGFRVFLFFRQKVVLRAKIAIIVYLQLLIKLYDSYHGLILILMD